MYRALLRQLEGLAKKSSEADASRAAEASQAQVRLRSAQRRWGAVVSAEEAVQSGVGLQPRASGTVTGATLMAIGAGDMLGEQALGFKAPEVQLRVDPAVASRQFVTARQQEKLAALARRRHGIRTPPAKAPSARKARLLHILAWFRDAIIQHAFAAG